MASQPLGTAGWIDLTVAEPEALLPFYQAVVPGFALHPVDMKDADGSYQDMALLNSEGKPTAGLCAARGDNAGLPPVWLVYFTVASLNDALAQATARGGELVWGPNGSGTMAVVRDPVGTVFALYQVAAEG